MRRSVKPSGRLQSHNFVTYDLDEKRLEVWAFHGFEKTGPDQLMEPN